MQDWGGGRQGRTEAVRQEEAEGSGHWKEVWGTKRGAWRGLG